MPHERFHYDSLGAVQQAAHALGAWLPLVEDTGCLAVPLVIAGRTLPNRIALQPMEGTDGDAGGAPGELTFRRYCRFARGGAALVWFEAVAIAPEVRASARQLMLTRGNLSEFQRMTDMIREESLRASGFAPMLILQATHSGRYSKPEGKPAPLIAYNNPCLEDAPIPRERILTDDAIERYEALYGETARLAQMAGFDGIDIKACHRYLASELLSAYTREGRYGGCFENRTRFLMNCFRVAKATVSGDFFLTCRLNAYDGFPYPHGFGVNAVTGLEPALDEAKRLVGLLRDAMRVPLVNITIGNPYKNPHVNRPYDQGGYVPDEHPLTGISRMMRCVSEIQRAYPALPVVGSAFSYLRQFAGHLAAGVVGGGHAAMAGFGRMAFAYPDFPRDLLHAGVLNSHKVCVTCGRCAGLLRAGEPAGCAVRDPQYRKEADA